MKKLVFAVAMAAGLSAGPVLAAEDPVWGAWASTDDDALAQILAVNDAAEGEGPLQLGPEDSAMLDPGSLLSGLVGDVLAAGNLDLSDLPVVGGVLDGVLGGIGLDTGGLVDDLGGTVDDVVNEACAALPLGC